MGATSIAMLLHWSPNGVTEPMQLMVVDVLKGLGSHGKKTDTLLNVLTFRRAIIAALCC